MVVASAASPRMWGARTSRAGAENTVYDFVGNEVDVGVGLSDFNARAYRPEAGIFLAPDPVALFEPEKLVGEPSKAWSYAYSSANARGNVIEKRAHDPYGAVRSAAGDAGSPVTLSDPTGLCPSCQFIHEQANRLDIPAEQREAAQRAERMNARVALFLLEGELAASGLKLFGKLVARTAVGKAALAKVTSVLAETGKKVARLFRPTASATPRVLNSANHVFGPKSLAKHGLEGVLEAFGGDKVAAFKALESGAQQLANRGAIKGAFETVVQVAGRNVTVRGAVVDGAAKVGTAFIP